MNFDYMKVFESLWPYLLTLGAIVVLHKLFFHSFMEFIRLLIGEMRDFARLRPTLGSLNFLGIIAVSIIVALFAMKDLVHSFDARPNSETHVEDGLYLAGMNSILVFFYFVFILLSIIICRGSSRK